MTKKKERVIGIGKRKEAVAKAYVKKGEGRIRVNKKPIKIIKPEMLRLTFKEPLILAEKEFGKVDIDVDVRGGGQVGQTEAARQAMVKGLVKFTGDRNLAEKFRGYNRNLLVKDFRRTEPHKPSRSSQGPRRHKQRSKR